ncbi:hypothetical protein AAE478_004812 [Parahypoxylon ruwenzoriense]
MATTAMDYENANGDRFDGNAPKDDNGNKDEDGSVNPGSNLFVTGIHPRLTEAEVTRLFEKYGEVEKCQIMKDPHTKESRGFGFVKMVTSEQADAAKDGLEGEEIENRTLSIEKARRARPRTPTPGKYFGPPKRVLICSNCLKSLDLVMMTDDAEVMVAVMGDAMTLTATEATIDHDTRIVATVATVRTGDMIVITVMGEVVMQVEKIVVDTIATTTAATVGMIDVNATMATVELIAMPATVMLATVRIVIDTDPEERIDAPPATSAIAMTVPTGKLLVPATQPRPAMANLRLGLMPAKHTEVRLEHRSTTIRQSDLPLLMRHPGNDRYTR